MPDTGIPASVLLSSPTAFVVFGGVGVGVCVGVAVLTGILFGLFPALQCARPEISQVMQSATRKVAGSVRGKQLHLILIAGQISLTLLLLTAAGATIERFVRMMHVNLGYDPHYVMSVGIPVHENAFKT